MSMWLCLPDLRAVWRSVHTSQSPGCCCLSTVFPRYPSHFPVVVLVQAQCNRCERALCRKHLAQCPLLSCFPLKQCDGCVTEQERLASFNAKLLPVLKEGGIFNMGGSGLFSRSVACWMQFDAVQNTCGIDVGSSFVCARFFQSRCDHQTDLEKHEARTKQTYAPRWLGATGHGCREYVAVCPVTVTDRSLA
jgi:hypothetical protein